MEFSHFTIVKMVATKLGRVGRLDAGLQQDPLVQTFWNIHNMDIKHQLESVTKSKKYFYIFNKKQKNNNNNKKNIQFTIEIA